MPNNDQIVLDKLLERRQQEIDPSADPSTFFELFAAEQVLKDHGLDYDEIDSGLIGGGRDGGIDGFFVFLDRQLVGDAPDLTDVRDSVEIELIVLQSKTATGFEETPIERFITVGDQILKPGTDPETLRETHRDELVDGIVRFRTCLEELIDAMPQLKVRFVYACKGVEPDPSVLTKAQQLRESVWHHFPSAECDVDFLGASQLLERSRQLPEDRLTLALAENPISSDRQGSGFVCLVRLSEFYKLITEDDALRFSIFEANVRDYHPTAGVNKEIQSSLRSADSEDFWWLNNGVSVLASDALYGGKKLTITNARIVNGLQTSMEVYRYFRDQGEHDDDRQILVRVIVSADTDSRDRIIKATNSQTSVPPPSLRATEPLHHHIESYLLSENIYYERRNNFYKNQRKPKARILTIKQLSQAVQAIALWRPDNARARPTDLFKEQESYEEVFNTGYPIRLYSVCAHAMHETDSCLREAKLSRKQINDLRFYVAMHVVAQVCSCHRPVPTEIAKLWIRDLSRTKVSESLQLVKREYESLGGNADVAKGSELLGSVRSDIERTWWSKRGGNGGEAP